MEFVKTGYKSHKKIRLYAKVELGGFEDQSAIKGNSSQNNAFLWPNKAL